MERLFSLLVLVLLPRPQWLFSLSRCTIDATDPGNVFCLDKEITAVPADLPNSTVCLEISTTQIQTIRRSDFSAFRDLQILTMNQNRISLIQDEAFSPLSSLTSLNLRFNRLTRLTDLMFAGLTNLTWLNLMNNQIQSISGAAFANLTKLEVLYLSGNSLSSPEDLRNIFRWSQGLCNVHLSGNPLLSLDFSNFPLLVNLTLLSLSYVPLTSFILHDDILPHLQILRLSPLHPEFYWNVSDQAFLRSLKILDLRFNHFKVETYQIILQSLVSVESLDLRGIRRLDTALMDLVCGVHTLQGLELSFNKIADLKNLLAPCTNLTELDLSENVLTDSGSSSLQMLTRLMKLDLSYNLLTKVPLAIRNLSSLSSLSLTHNSITKLECKDFSELQMLTELDLSHNQLTELSSCMFQSLQNLQRLNVEQNNIVRVGDTFSSSLPNLQVLQLNDNNIKKLRREAFGNLSALTELQLESDKGTLVESGVFDGLKHLTTASFSLRVLTQSNSKATGRLFSSRGRSHKLGLPALQTLVLRVHYSLCYLWPRDLFQGSKNLTTLFLQHSFCHFWPPNSETFQYTPHLLNLTMIKNENWLPVPGVFWPLTDLQTLDLSENQLKSVDFLSEANLTQLQTLILRHNELSVINVSVFKALPSLRHLDLSENLFVCDCSNADFILWTILNKKVFVEGAFQYKCASPASHQGALLLEFNVRGCIESLPHFLVSSGLVLLMLFSFFMHHFLRLQLLYGFYLLRAALLHRQKLRRGCEELYDAFVSYSIHDEHWVYRELVPELEKRQGWRLCLHHRDFEPGKAILENITDAIYSSRKTLCVISRRYLMSEWCSHEIQMASFRLVDEKKDVLVLILLEELSANQLSPFFRMRKLLRSRTYLSWSGARRHRGLFWERVRRALQAGTRLPADTPLPADD